MLIIIARLELWVSFSSLFSLISIISIMNIHNFYKHKILFLNSSTVTFK